MSLILVIDDEEGMRRTVERMLRAAKHQVLLAADGRAGLELFLEHRPDIVITDVVMPEKEGIETVMEIRAADRDVKIIVISGKAPIGTLDFLSVAEKLGADRTLSKPFRVQELLSIIEELCAAGRPGAGGTA